MTQTALRGARKTAEIVEIVMSTENHGYRLEVLDESTNRWAIKMFDMTLARAIEYAKYFRQTRIVGPAGIVAL